MFVELCFILQFIKVESCIFKKKITEIKKMNLVTIIYILLRKAYKFPYLFHFLNYLFINPILGYYNLCLRRFLDKQSLFKL